MRLFRKIIFGLILSVAIGALIYSYFYVKKIKTPVSEAVNAIPLNASFIFESRGSINLWKKLSETSIMWEDLLGTEFFSRLNRNGNFLDSTILTHPKIEEMLNNRPVFISAHPCGASGYGFLYVYSLPNVTQQWLVDGLVNDIAGKSSEVKEYNGSKIYTVKTSSVDTFTYAFSKGIFISSFNGELVEDALRQLSSGKSLIYNKSFSSVQHSAGENVEASLFINYKTLPDLLGRFLEPETKKQVASLSNFSEWTEVDLAVKPNSLMLNGFTSSNDSLNSYLNLFLRQKPQQAELVKILPASTSTLLFFGVSNFKNFHNSYKSYLELNHKLFDYQQKLEQLDKECHLSLEKYLLSWINNEMALVITEPITDESTGECYAVFHSNNIEDALSKLKCLSDSVNKTLEQKTDTETFRGRMIRLLDLPSILPKLIGMPFERMHETYFTSIGNYVIYANSINSLKNFISSYESGKTLKNSKIYEGFSENLSNESNIYLYSGIARSTSLYSTLLNEKFAPDVEAFSDIYHKFEAIGIQFSSDEKMFYNNIYLKHNPIYKQETSSVWEVQLDDSVSSQPLLVVNHNTKAKEVFVQDNSNKIYLISNTGKILWKKQLPEKILGGVQQVDVLKNNKFQMLFNTSSAIYVIDRNGKDYGAFPLKLKSPATAPLAAFDYENNRDYRILIPCQNKKVYNYKISGELITGWKFDKAENEVLLAPQHCMVGDKDYIVILDKAGKIYLMDRQGETRSKIREQAGAMANAFFLETGKNPSNTSLISTDTLGNILKITFTGDFQSTKLKNFDSKPSFLYQDINNDKTSEYLLIDKNQLDVYNQDKTMRFHYEFKNEVLPFGQYFNFGNGKGKTGIVSAATNEILLIDENGVLQEGFPLFGNTPFSIGDVNNDHVYYLITGSANHIYAYLLQ